MTCTHEYNRIIGFLEWHDMALCIYRYKWFIDCWHFVVQWLRIHLLKKHGQCWHRVTLSEYDNNHLKRHDSHPLTLFYIQSLWHNFVLAPVPLSIFRSNSKFDENSKHSSVKYTRPITTIFCTRHDSVTVVTCAKYRCDRLSIFETRAFWIFIEFRIRSKYA